MILINIGDELLIGQVVNTNAAFIGQQMALAGFSLTDVLTIGDNGDDIRQTVSAALAKTDVVLMTGGLGPTKDDITKKVICDIFQRSLVMDEPTLEHVTQLFAARGMELTDTNRDQALVPDGCTVLYNPLGTAPGLWMEDNGKVLIALPGVPFEMERLIKEEVMPRLKNRDERHHAIEYRVLQCTGITESGLSDLLVDYERELPAELKLAYLPKPGIIRLRLTGQSDDREKLLEMLDEQFQKLKVLTKEYAFTDEDIELEEVVGRLLVKANKTLATAESCTGGYIAHLITKVPGSSRYFQGSLVSYSNEVKRDLLNVREDNLKRRGAVSEQVVSDMALNAMGLFDVDYTIATSGIAGPDGGTAQKPVGTVWIAIATPVRLITKEFHFGSRTGRQQIVERAAHAALNMLRIAIEQDLNL
ncbi:MAG: competence/damage-inducible protein A [Bacteroidales bacterium]|nr:competence/damage-inducible protein A [Bacteroidales bacterium]